MNNTIKNNPRTALAGALSVALMFAAGGVMAQQTQQDRDRATQDVTGTQQTHGAAGMDRDHDRAHDRDRGLDRDSDQPVNDTWITTKVKSSLLADSDVAGLDVSVETVNGEVRLTGNVDSQMQVDRATQIARDIEGVTSVNASGLNTTGGTGTGDF